MGELFTQIMNMGITAGWIVLAVMLLRLLLKKAPKWITMTLWVFVALRLVCPFSVESMYSLIPSVQTLPSDFVSGPNFEINSGIGFVDRGVNQYLGDRYFEGVTVPVDNAKNIMEILAIVWLAGIVVMIAYAIISFLRVRHQVREAAFLHDNVWICDSIATPFILGIIKPRIYLPASLREEDMPYVIAHEKAHLKRRDHIWKPVGFLLLAAYWFHPILWVGYVLLCRDIEMACDEKVLKELGKEQKKPYAEALVNCSVPRKMVMACPLAFGENGVRQRVKSILNYKRPAFWIVLISVLACIVAGVCLLSNPKEKEFESGEVGTEPERKAYDFTYRYMAGNDSATLSLSRQDYSCSFSYSYLSSYYLVGTYGESDRYIVVKSDDGMYHFTFEKIGSRLIFLADKSSAMPSFRYTPDSEPHVCVPDRAIFEMNSVAYNGTKISLGMTGDEFGLEMMASATSETGIDVYFFHTPEVMQEAGTLETSASYEIKIQKDGGEMVTIGEYKGDDTYVIKEGETTKLPHDIAGKCDVLTEGHYFLYKDVTLTTESGEKITKTYSTWFDYTP